MKSRRTKVRTIHRNHGRTFRHPVPLEGTDPELFLKRGGKTFRQFLGTGQDDANRAKLFRQASPPIELQKGRRRNQDRHPLLFKKIADGPRVQRRGMIDHAHTMDDGQPQRRQVTKGMKERQDAQYAVGRPDMKKLHDLLNVGINIEVTEHHSLRLSGAPTAEDNRRKIIQLGTIDRTDALFQHADGRKQGQGKRLQSFGCSNGLANLFDPHDLDTLGHFKIGFFKEHATRHDRFETGLPGHRLDPASPDRVIEIDDGASRQRGGKIDQCSADAGRQQNAHGVLVHPVRAERPGQRDGAGERFQTRDSGPGRVGKGKPQGMATSRTNKGMMEQPPVGFSMAPGFLTQFLHALPDVGCRDGRRHGCPIRHRDGIGNAFRPFHQKFSADETEDAAPYPIEMNGDHGDLPPLDDAFESLTKRQETTRPGNLPFGKDADDFPFIQPATGLAEGMENLPR